MNQDLNPISLQSSPSAWLRWLVSALVVAALMLITGCATKTETITVTKTEYIATPVPSAFTTPLVVPVPPKQEDFLAADDKEQMEMLRKYILKLLPVIKDSNESRKKLRKWSDDIVNRKNTAEKNQDILGDLIQSKENTGGK